MNPLEMTEADFLYWLNNTNDDRGLRRSIGGSSIGAIMGLNPYKKPCDVWDTFFGTRPPDSNYSKHLDRGIRMEPIIADIYAEQTGRHLAHRGTTYAQYKGALLHSMVDRMIMPCEGRAAEGVLELKCPDDFAYDLTLTRGIDSSYFAQWQFYAGIENVTWGAFGLFNVSRWELHKFDLEADTEYQNGLFEGAAKFWNEHILTRRRPEGPRMEVEELPPAPIRLGATMFEWTTPRQKLLLEQLRTATEEAKLAAAVLESVKTSVQEEMIACDTDTVVSGQNKVTWKESTKRTLSRELLVEAGIDPTPYEKVSAFRTFRPTFGRGPRT